MKLKHLLTIVLTLLMMLGSFGAFAQAIIVSGVVMDDAGEPLPGASVVIKGTSIYVMTDANGKYAIDVPNSNDFLVFSFIGYQTFETQVGKRTKIDVYLDSDFEMLDEVVMIGYGTAKKRDLTGAISNIKSEDLRKTNMTSLEQSLQGRMAGVFVIETDGAPGGGMSIQIRGSNSMLGGTEPLYVVDGIPISSDNAAFAGREGFTGVGSFSAQGANVLSTINPADIASIEVLKDASATAIYGSRGANGVILITTKQGMEGKSSINVDYTLGVSILKKKIDVLNGMEYAEFVNEAEWNAAVLSGTTANYRPQYASPEYIAAHPEATAIPFPTTAGTNWQDLIYTTGISHNASINISGGTKKTKYAVMMGAFDQKGIIKKTGFRRFSLRSNIKSEVKKWLTVQSSIALTRSNNKLAYIATNGEGKAAGIIRRSIMTNPNISMNQIIDETVNANFNSENLRNPWVELTHPTDRKVDNRVLAGLNLDFKLHRNLTFKVFGSANYFDTSRDMYQSMTTFAGSSAKGILSNSHISSLELVNENMLTYTNQWNKHSFTGTAVFSYEYNNYENHFMQGQDFAMDKKPSFDKANHLKYTVSNGSVISVLLSGLFRLNYNYGKRYYVTVSLRADGSSKFSKDNKFAYFPSAALTWRLSEEKFFKEAKTVMNLFKIRYSFGTTGNQAINPYQTLATMVNTNCILNGMIVNGLVDSRLPSQGLKWETTTQHNVGIDYAFLNDRINGSINYYYKKTSDLLQYITIPASTGWQTQLQNNGAIMNQGFEFEINANPIMKDNVQWTIGANISTNKNKILYLGNDVEMIYSKAIGRGMNMQNAPIVYKVGYPLGTFWGYQTDGIVQTEEQLANLPNWTATGDPKRPGEVIYKDISGPDGKPDGIVNSYDQTYLGDPNPDLFFGLNTSISFYGFNIYMQFTGAVGYQIYNQTALEYTMLNGYENVPTEVYRNAWRGPGTTNKYTSVLPNGPSQRARPVSDRFIEDASFLRLKTLRLGYDIPTKGKFGQAVKNFNVFVSGDNLFVVTNYSGFDPEVSSFGQSPDKKGIDLGSYPKPYTFIVGLNITF